MGVILVAQFRLHIIGCRGSHCSACTPLNPQPELPAITCENCIACSDSVRGTYSKRKLNSPLSKGNPVLFCPGGQNIY